MKINQPISLIAIAHTSKSVNYPDIFMAVHLFLSCKGENFSVTCLAYFFHLTLKLKSKFSTDSVIKCSGLKDY